MQRTIPDILARIAGHKREQLAAKRLLRAQWEAMASAQAATRRDFRAALLANPPSVIAEMKKASPSKGVLNANFQPATIAATYQQGGAAALSVLTDDKFFQGSLDDLRAARAAVPLPVLRKDFTLDEIDVVEAAAAGADAFLLIAALLTTDEMRRFRELGAQFGMAALAEVHNAAELARVVDSGAEIIGVNNRDLHTFQVHFETSMELAAMIPAHAVRVAESGIHGPADLARLTQAGFQAFLVGEHLMKSPDPAAALVALRGATHLGVPV
jgi:indole-3-glycerol phosphate synthase